MYIYICQVHTFKCMYVYMYELYKKHPQYAVPVVLYAAHFDGLHFLVHSELASKIVYTKTVKTHFVLQLYANFNHGCPQALATLHRDLGSYRSENAFCVHGCGTQLCCKCMHVCLCVLLNSGCSSISISCCYCVARDWEPENALFEIYALSKG